MSTRDTLVQQLQEGDRSRRGGAAPFPGDILRTTLDLAARYARVERLLFGSPGIAYSTSALGLDLSLERDVVQQGESLAEAERMRLDLPEGPILDLGFLIEDQGVKILPGAFPNDSRVRGGFFFSSELGPCILVDALAPDVERDYIVAHQYGHFLADYDPYITTLCGHPDAAIDADPCEMRAHAFALAFLMPRSDCELYREGMGVEPGAPIPIELVRQLQVYFEVDFEMVFWRLLGLGWIDAPHMRALLEENAGTLPDLRERDIDPSLSKLVPERFVHLVASAFGKRLIEIEGAAEYLGTDVAGAKRILGKFHFEDRSEPKPAAPAPPLPPKPSIN